MADKIIFHSEVEEKTIPLGVKILGVCYYISVLSFFGIFFNIVELIPLIVPFINNLLVISALSMILINGISNLLFSTGGGFSFSGIISYKLSDYIIYASFITWSVVSFFIARGLFKLKKWARTTSIIFLFLGIISFIALVIWNPAELIIFALPSLIIYFIALFYLLNKKVKAIF